MRGVSHLLSYWVTVQPLGQLLAEAIDGGELLHPQFWHPLRDPAWHRPARVRILEPQIAVAWEQARAELPQDDGGWLAREVSALLSIYWHAATAGECLVTALERPADDERGRRVRLPWVAAWSTDSVGRKRPIWKLW